MYSPFSSLSRCDFIGQELAREYLSFPHEIDEAYSEVIDWLSGLDGMADFDKSGNVKLDSHELLHTGRQFSRFLPAHTMKVYQTLLHHESSSINRQSISILEQPYISLIDDGCGGGTASIALISLAINYQEYRLANQLPTFPITISCLGIDPNNNALKIYGTFLRKCAYKIRHLLVDVKIRIFPGTLPENTASIIEWIADQQRKHCVILALANIIRPLTNEYAEASTLRSFFDDIGLGKFLPSRFGKDIGAMEVTTLSAILNANNTDYVVALLVSARSTDGGTRRRWQDEMTAFQNAVNSKLSTLHRVSMDSIKSHYVKIVNPADSYYRRRQGYEKSIEFEYDRGLMVIYNKDYLKDNDWQKILDLNNLLLAWARVRNALSFEMLEDTIEIRLFEANIEERLAKLRGEILAYRWESLNIVKMLNLRIPKGLGKDPRPMSVCRLEDQILATAILQVKGEEYTTAHHSRSYAYELFAKQQGERLYKGWFEQYQNNFLAKARKVAGENPSYRVIRTDLLSYYTDIIQSELFLRIERQMGLYNSRSSELAEKLLKRDCGIDKNGFGIPQGHIVSGAMANLFLAEVDNLFGPDNRWGVEYFRFVDDMIFMFPSSVEADFILSQLDQKLSDLGLTRSEDKTSSPMSTQEFLELAAPDNRLEYFGKEHNVLLSELYRLGKDYIRISLKDWWSFVECYQKLLVSIGVYISVPRLSRKLQKNLRWFRRQFSWWHKLKMPKVERLSDLKDIDKWQSEFSHYHTQSPNGWVYRRQKLAHDLSELFRSSLANLDSDSEIESARSQTRLKFALNRLGQLGFGEEAEAIVDLIVEQPWILHPRRVCHDLALQGREDLLIDAFNRTQNYDEKEWGYVRGAILKAVSSLPSVSEETIQILEEAMYNGKTILERTMSSESLFLLQMTETLQRENLVNVSKQTEDDYLSKNYVLLHAITPGDGEKLKTDLNHGRLLNEAIEYVRVMPECNQLYCHEPDILREKFYESDYPDDPEEFEDFPY